MMSFVCRERRLRRAGRGELSSEAGMCGLGPQGLVWTYFLGANDVQTACDGIETLCVVLKTGHPEHRTRGRREGGTVVSSAVRRPPRRPPALTMLQADLTDRMAVTQQIQTRHGKELWSCPILGDERLREGDRVLLDGREVVHPDPRVLGKVTVVQTRHRRAR